MKMGLRFKWICTIVFFLLLISLETYFVSVRQGTNTIRKELIGKGLTLTKGISYSSEYGILTENKDILKNLIRKIVGVGDIDYCAIYDKNGNILAHTGLIKTKLTELAKEEAIKEGYSIHKGNNYFDIIVPVVTKIIERQNNEEALFSNGNEWITDPNKKSEALNTVIGFVQAGISEVNAIENINKLRNDIATITTIVALFGILIIIFFVNQLTKPIHLLNIAIQKVSEGDFSHKVIVRTRDEIGQLAKAFNKMAEDLKRSRDEIQEYNRTLEKKIEEKTKELKDTQAQLIQSAKMAAIGQLGAGVAHEINNPLAGILGYAQFILNKIKKPELFGEDLRQCEEYMKHIERESQRCKTVVENLLDFSRKSPTAFEKTSIISIIENTISLIRHSLELQNINISTNYAPDLPMVLGNSNQLQQIFTNIIINAKQAMPKGGELRIRVKTIEKDTKKYLEIIFQDTGCGIPKENLDKIFDAFFTTKQDWKSLGIGLSISYNIITEHKGKISVESELGRGSIFTVHLPTV